MKIEKTIITIVFIVLTSMTFYISYSFNLNDINNNFIHLISYKFNKKIDYKIDFVGIYIDHLKRNNENYFKKTNQVFKTEEEILVQASKNEEEPIIYIYNTHSSEVYNYLKNDVYNIIPTVKTASYILEAELEKLGINTIVEEENTTDILNNQKLPYSDSYKVSRKLLENKKVTYNSLTYFIDLHRDSVKRSITTVEIEDTSYAKIMFVLGLENENYQKNKELITKLNDYLNLNYPGLSRGIYEKKGSGVNGIYNQDFSPNTMLIEVGGVDNTIEEVANTITILATSLYNLIN